MADKSIEDMAASELLRWAALDERDKFQNITPQGRLLSALAGSDYVYTDSCCGRDLFRQLADKIDAEISDACLQAVLESKKPIWWFKSAIARGEDWPEPREGEKFRHYLDRCFIPRPRFEDGEPVQDSDMEEIGALATCCVYMDGSWAFNPDKYEDETNPKPWDVQSGAGNDRIKRPAPEVLGADGLPIKVGDAMWSLSGAGPLTVTSLHTDGPTPDGGDFPWADLDDDGLYSWIYAGSLTHTPPDTRAAVVSLIGAHSAERIDKLVREGRWLDE